MKKPFHIFLLLTAALIAAGCSDDDNFTLDTSSRLTFESDTVRFDTVFSTIGSSTRRVKVYNPNDKGIRISSVTLASGGSSGFRINVDGHSGPSLADIEILKKDSLFLFAEVTVNPHDADSPVLVRDSIIFRLESGVSQQMILEAYGQDVVILRARDITADETFTSARPYLVYDSLTVQAGATLTLAAGTTLCFHAGAFLGVHGTLVCDGTLEQPVTFRGDRTDRLFSYLPYDRMDAQWGGITLYPESSGNSFEHADIHGGNWGIRCPQTTTDELKLRMTNSAIHNVAGDGLRLVGAAAVCLNSQFSNAGGNCVSLVGGTAQFVHCTLAQFYPWDSEQGSALYFTNTENDTIYPLEAADFYNCVITGRNADELAGNPAADSGAAFNASFPNSLVNIHLTGNEPDSILNMFSASVNEYELFPSASGSSGTTAAGEDSRVYGRLNFRLIDDAVYSYDFQLDSLSNARGIGSGDYVTLCPTDKNGKPRPASHPDAGCYQF